ncbi:MAG TPA: hypothetical protein VLP43_04140 [Solirubrobacteraceae bacterium]|nr:hypothetical protein [Solirubrobacteraceae bacterium]
MRRLAFVLSLIALVWAPGALAGGARAPALTGTHCTVLPADNPWNQRVDGLPVARGSAGLIATIGNGSPVHPDFGTVYNGAPNGIPFAIVTRHTRRVPVTFTYAGESDGHRYPLSPNVPIEGGTHSSGDRHVIVVDRDTCTAYELYGAYPHAGGRRWSAGSGAIFNLRTDRLRPAGRTSADAAGLPILPGLARYDEVSRGAIDHALRFTVPCTAQRYVYPARHDTSGGRPDCPPMGTRVRLKAAVDIASLPHQARIVAAALKRYGMIVADNGSPWYISGAPNRRWNDGELHELNRLSGHDFEVVDTRSLPRPGL